MSNESWTVVATLETRDQTSAALKALAANARAAAKDVADLQSTVAKASTGPGFSGVSASAVAASADIKGMGTATQAAVSVSTGSLRTLEAQLRNLRGLASGNPITAASAAPAIAELEAEIAARRNLAAVAAATVAPTAGAAVSEDAGEKLVGMAAAATAGAVAEKEIGAATRESAKEFQRYIPLLREVGMVMPDEALAGRFNNFRASGLRAVAMLAQINPVAAGATAAIVAVGGSLAAGVVHAEAFDETMGRLNAALDATGRGGDMSSGQLGDLVRQLRDLRGVSTASAEAMVGDFSRAREIGASSFLALGEAAAGYARVTGEKVPDAAKQLTAALEGGYASLRKLDEAYNFLTPAQAEQIRSLDAQGQKMQAVSIAVDALNQHFAKLQTEGVTPLQSAAHGFADAWDHMLDRLGNSAPITVARDALAGLLNVATGLVNAGSQQTVLRFRHLEYVKPDNATSPAARATAPRQDDSGAALKDSMDRYAQERGAADQLLQIQSDITRMTQAEVTAHGAMKTALDGDIAAAKQKLAAIHEIGAASQVQAMRAKLDDQLMNANGGKGAFGQQAQTMEIAYWSARLAEAQKGSAAYVQIQQRLYSVLSANYKADVAEQGKATRDAFANYSETMQQKMAAARGNVLAEEAIADQWLAHAKSVYGSDVREYRNAISAIETIAREETDFKRSMLDMQAADRTSASLAALNQNFRAANPGLSPDTSINAGAGGKGKGVDILALFGLDDVAGIASQVAAKLDYLEQVHQSKIDEMKARFADAGGDSSQLEGLASQSSSGVDIARSVNFNTGQSSAVQALVTENQSYANQMTEVQQNAAAATKQAWENALSPISSAFDQSIKGVIQGTQTIGAALKNMGQSVVLSMLDNSVKNLVKSAADSLATTGIGGAVSRGASAIGLGGKAAGEATQNAALTANTLALHTLAAALTGHVTAIGANTASTALNSASTGVNSVSTGVNSASTGSNTIATAANTGGIFSHLGALIGHEITMVENNLATAANTIATWAKAAVSAIPGLAVGTNYVPGDGLAYLHEGEAVVPKKYNTGGYGMASRGDFQIEKASFANDNPASGTPVGAQGYGDVHYHVTPQISVTSLDPSNAASLIRAQGPAIAAAFNDVVRSGQLANFPALSRAMRR